MLVVEFAGKSLKSIWLNFLKFLSINQNYHGLLLQSNLNRFTDIVINEYREQERMKKMYIQYPWKKEKNLSEMQEKKIWIWLINLLPRLIVGFKLWKEK